ATVLRNRWAVWLLALSLLQGAVMFGFVTYFAPALEAGGHSPAIAGAVVAGYGVAVLVCTRAFGHVARLVPAALLLAGGATILTVPLLVGGSLGRWRYRGSDLVGEDQRGNQIG